MRLDETALCNGPKPIGQKSAIVLMQAEVLYEAFKSVLIREIRGRQF